MKNIEVGKFYVTRSGDKVRIYATDACSTYPIHGSVLEATDDKWGPPRSWTGDGAHTFGDVSSVDIVGKWVEPHPLTKAKRGDLVWVSDVSDSSWLLYEFSHIDDGTVYVFSNSNRNKTIGFRHGKLYTGFVNLD